jgi:hypothetical protein
MIYLKLILKGFRLFLIGMIGILIGLIITTQLGMANASADFDPEIDTDVIFLYSINDENTFTESGGYMTSIGRTGETLSTGSNIDFDGNGYNSSDGHFSGTLSATSGNTQTVIVYMDDGSWCPQSDSQNKLLFGSQYSSWVKWGQYYSSPSFTAQFYDNGQSFNFSQSPGECSDEFFVFRFSGSQADMTFNDITTTKTSYGATTGSTTWHSPGWENNMGNVKGFMVIDRYLTNDEIEDAKSYFNDEFSIPDIDEYLIFGTALSPKVSIDANNEATINTLPLYPGNGIPEMTLSTGVITAGCGQYILLPSPESGYASFDSGDIYIQYGKYLSERTFPNDEVEIFYNCSSESEPDFDLSTWDSFISNDFVDTEYLEGDSFTESETCGTDENLHLVIYPYICEDLSLEEKIQIRVTFDSVGSDTNIPTFDYLTGDIESGCPFDSPSYCAGYNVLTTGVAVIYGTIEGLVNSLLGDLYENITVWHIQNEEEYCATYEETTICNTTEFQENNSILDLIINIVLLGLIVQFVREEILHSKSET